MNRTFAIGAACAALLLAGCIEHDTDREAALPQYGTLDVAFTIRGHDTAPLCRGLGASWFELVAWVDRARRPYASVRVPCESFRATLELLPGAYQLDATLLDEHKRPIARPLALPPVSIPADESVPIKVDFSDDAFGQ